MPGGEITPENEQKAARTSRQDHVTIVWRHERVPGRCFVHIGRLDVDELQQPGRRITGEEARACAVHRVHVPAIGGAEHGEHGTAGNRLEGGEAEPSRGGRPRPHADAIRGCDVHVRAVRAHEELARFEETADARIANPVDLAEGKVPGRRIAIEDGERPAEPVGDVEAASVREKRATVLPVLGGQGNTCASVSAPVVPSRSNAVMVWSTTPQSGVVRLPMT
jgi:hypothetical protein